MKNNKDFLIFAAGLFAMTEIYIGGFAAISELVMFLSAPFVFLRSYTLLKKDGFWPMIVLFFLTIIGCCIATYVNKIPLPYFLRGFAAIYGTWCAFVCMHSLLRDDFGRVKWFFVGYSISLIINIFIFQRGSSRHGYDTSLFSNEAMESTINSVLFWAGRLPHWLYLPIRGWFLSVPSFYSLSTAIIVAVVSLLGSGGSGRAATLCAVTTFVFLLVGRKTMKGLRTLQKNILLVFVLLVFVGFLGKSAYSHLAQTGALGESGARKYEEQTKSGTGILNIIISGRSEFFAGLYCAINNPIVGYGPWAIDWDGLSGEFLYKYGTSEAYEEYLRYNASATRKIKYPVIPSHSCVIGFWTWYGIFGLLLWLYILRLYWKTLTRYFVCYPPWFGCIATILPTAVWDAFFSPYGNRIMMALFFAMCLFLKAVYERRIPPGGAAEIYREIY